VIRAEGTSVVDGGDGDDQIDVGSYGHVDGGAGNDTIKATGLAHVHGGVGDDTITVGRMSTVTYGAGDGKDTITTNGPVVVQLGEGLSADQMQLTVSGNEARISFGDGADEITLHMPPGSSAQLAFADGRTIDVRPDSPDNDSQVIVGPDGAQGVVVVPERIASEGE